jgi:Ca-activated chloride channel homolog
MKFGFPDFLWLLVLVPVVGLLVHMASLRRRNALARFGNNIALARQNIQPRVWASRLRLVLVMTAAAGMILAGARPQWGYEDRRIVSRGVDMMIAIDTSASMLAQDIKPTRLQRAKELLQNIVWEARGDRIGIMAFAGNAVVLCPLTLDYGMASTALTALDINSVPTRGTAIGTAIDSAIKAFDASGSGERVLVLLTDGEDQGTNPIEAAKKAAEAKMKIFTIGLGSEKGHPIPMERGFKQDKQGRVVQSKLDFATLQEIARITGGSAFRAEGSGTREVTAMLAEVAKMKGVMQQDRVFRVYKERYAWFLIPALLVLIADAFGWGRGRRANKITPSAVVAPKPRTRGKQSLATTSLLCLVVMLPGLVSAYPGEEKIISNRALEQFSQQNYKKASELYSEAVAKDPNSQVTKFNLGAAQYKAGEEKQAEETFRSVYDSNNLKLNAANEYNLGLINHKKTEKTITEKLPNWEQAIATGDKAAVEEVKKINEQLESVLGQYKQALLKDANLSDAKVNYELAQRDLAKLKELLNRQPPPSPEQQQQDQKQEQDKKDQEKKEQDKKDQQEKPQQDNSKQDEQSGSKGESDKNDNAQNQGKKPDNPDKKDEPKSDSNKDGKPEEKKDGGDKKEDNKDQTKGEQKDSKEPGKEDKPEDKPDQQGKNGEAKQPKPSDEKNGEAGGESGEEQEVPMGQMSKADVERLLNSLPDENQKALQRFLNTNYKSREDMEKDW